MTREEAVEFLIVTQNISPEHMMELLEALEQEPCEDAISRQAVDDAIYDYSRSCNVDYSQIMEYIEKLPSVTPQQKTGMWIEHFDEIGKWYECDQCHTDWGGTVNYCPNCGAKMEGAKMEVEYISCTDCEHRYDTTCHKDKYCPKMEVE